MRIENMDFGPGHQGGMPSAAELRWRAKVERVSLEERYGEAAFPVSETNRIGASDETPVAKAPAGMPGTGTIDNFGTRTARTDIAFMQGMIGVPFSK